MKREQILQQAIDIVCHGREEQYGSPEDNFRMISALWEVYIRAKCASPESEITICPEDVSMMMALLKIARIATGTAKADSFIDLAGYAACGGEIAIRDIG